MNCLRLWMLLTSLTASSALLLADTWQAFVTDPNTNQVFPINVSPGQTPAPETPVSGISTPRDIKILSDGSKAIVGNLDIVPAPNVFSLDLMTSPISVTSASIGFSGATGPSTLAISPDDTKIYGVILGGQDIDVIQTNTLSLLTTIPGSEFGSYHPNCLALSPNKSEGYVGATLYGPGNSRIFIIDTSTNHVMSDFALTNAITQFLSVTPNGEELYISYYDSPALSYVLLNEGTTVNNVTGLPSATQTKGIAITPDGSTLFAIQQISGNWFLTKVDTETHAYVTHYPIPSDITAPFALSITPDGRTACIPDRGSNSNGHIVAFMDLESGSSTLLDLTSAQNSSLFLSAVTPDQAPTARYILSASGLTVTMDASASSSPVGGIATYAWDFGDGQTQTTTTPTTSHTYSSGGTFLITLTVTNTAGTSTNVTYTGQMVSNKGGPSAVLTQQITIPQSSIGVASFTGKTRIYRNVKKKIFLKTKWSKLLPSNPRKVVIYERNKKVATMYASHRHHKLLRLHPRNIPHKVSKDYERYLEHKYNIRVIDTFGHISNPTYIHIVKH